METFLQSELAQTAAVEIMVEIMAATMAATVEIPAIKKSIQFYFCTSVLQKNDKSGLKRNFPQERIRDTSQLLLYSF